MINEISHENFVRKCLKLSRKINKPIYNSITKLPLLVDASGKNAQAYFSVNSWDRISYPWPDASRLCREWLESYLLDNDCVIMRWNSKRDIEECRIENFKYNVALETSGLANTDYKSLLLQALNIILRFEKSVKKCIIESKEQEKNR